MTEKNTKKVNEEITEELLKTNELADEDMGDVTGGAALSRGCSRSRLLKANAMSLKSASRARALNEEDDVDTIISEN